LVVLFINLSGFSTPIYLFDLQAKLVCPGGGWRKRWRSQKWRLVDVKWEGTPRLTLPGMGGANSPSPGTTSISLILSLWGRS
jgi:hypothetical protein